MNDMVNLLHPDPGQPGWEQQQPCDQQAWELAKISMRLTKLAREAIRGGAMQWEDLPEDKRWQMTALIIQRETRETYRTDYLTAAPRFNSLPLKVADVLQEGITAERLTELGKILIESAVICAEYEGQKILDKTKKAI